MDNGVRFFHVEAAAPHIFDCVLVEPQGEVQIGDDVVFIN